MAKINKDFLYVCTFLLMCGCSKDVDIKSLESKDADYIYKFGLSKMEEGKNDDAQEIFEEFEKLYPYSKLSSEVQLNLAECQHKQGRLEDANYTYDSFVRTHPTHIKVPFALYKIGIINFEQMPIVERDQEVSATALLYFDELCKKFPNSEYISDAKVKIKLLRNQIAGREVYIARYYQVRKNAAAAIGRLNTVIDSYSDTKHFPEALHRLIECYVAMGFIDEAMKVYAILKKADKDKKWLEYSKSSLEMKGAR